ncbi:MAG: S1 family peptidase [Myxococcota bacterium]
MSRALWVLIPLVVDACAAPEGPVSSSTSALFNASPAAADAHPSAVAVLATYGRQGQVFCSGVQVLPDVVLTAGHCVQTFAVARQQVGAGIRFWVSGQEDLTEVARGRVPADAIPITHELAPPELLQQGDLLHDIGVLLLGARRDPGAFPRLIAADAEPKIVPGLPVLAVGWGLGAPEETRSDHKRSGAAVAGAVTDHYLGFGGPTRGGTAIACSGDSGGPVYVMEGGNEILVGLMSRSDCETYTSAIRPEGQRGYLETALRAACFEGTRIACEVELPLGATSTAVPSTVPTEPPALVSHGIEAACANQVALGCTDFASSEECLSSMNTALAATADPACVPLSPEVERLLTCTATSCYAGCDRGAADRALRACSEAPLPDAGQPAQDAGTLDLGQNDDAGAAPDAGAPLDAGSTPDGSSAMVTPEGSGCSCTRPPLRPSGAMALGLIALFLLRPRRGYHRTPWSAFSPK